ncbi:MAG: helix-turn-helix domain-containing protein [Oscillospiraceae bacterium]|nr:helix-turn-helix domain-containing protein [Oscillospiraceae bacterium]
MDIIGSRIRTLREGFKMSQGRIAKLNGSNQSSIGRYENGESSTPLQLLLWYANYFDVSMDYIFGRTDKPQGKLYDFKPKIEDDDDMRLFIEMCFDPKSPVSEKLKDTLLQMMKGGDASE